MSLYEPVNALLDCIQCLHSIINKIESEPAVCEGGRRFPTIKQCVEATAKHYGITMQTIVSDDQTRLASRIRQVAVYVSKTLTIKSYASIGHVMGRDHSTVIRGYKIIESRRHQDPILAKDIQDISSKILSGVQRDAPPGPVVGSLHPLQATGPNQNGASHPALTPGAPSGAVAEPSLPPSLAAAPTP